LPGITGSSLYKDDKPLWEVTPNGIWTAVFQPDFLDELRLKSVDDGRDDLGDGVIVKGVMEDAHIVPGLIKIVDGYTSLRRLIQNNFDLVQVGENGEIRNYFEFAYDWRRDNRVSARKLDEFVRTKLAAWRSYTGTEDARLIFLAHSMGGLIVKYFLEVLEGWKDTKALISFGTPYLGSLNAVKRFSQMLCSNIV